MYWKDINSIILPLFLSEATPVEKNRDNALSEAHKKVVEYCRELPLGKHPNSSYLCRLQIESDCLDRDKAKACDLLAQLKDLERRARDSQYALKEKKEHDQFFCHAGAPAPEIIGKFEQNQNVFAVPAMTSNIREEDLRKLSQSSQAKWNEMQALIKKVRLASYSRSCQKNSDCRAIPVGHKSCGGALGAIAFSGQLSFEGDLKKIESLDREINREAGYASTCNIDPNPTATCQQNLCELLMYL